MNPAGGHQEDVCKIPYGAPPNVMMRHVAVQARYQQNPAVSFVDCKCHLEAYFSAFITLYHSQ